MPAPDCVALELVVGGAGGYARAKAPAPPPDCATCQGTGLVPAERQENGRTYVVSRRCPVAERALRAQLFNQAGLPAVQAGSTFDNYVPAKREQDVALRTAREFAFGWPSRRGYVVSGPVGTGKTHLLVATLRHLALERAVKVAYVEISLLYANIRRGFAENKSGGEIIQPLSRVEVLAIDELGKGKGSQFELETLDELIARRYNAGLITLFATNYSLKAPEDRGQRGLVTAYSSANGALEGSKEPLLIADRLGDRMYSRLCEMCDFLQFPLNTPDARRARVTFGGK